MTSLQQSLYKEGFLEQLTRTWAGQQVLPKEPSQCAWHRVSDCSSFCPVWASRFFLQTLHTFVASQTDTSRQMFSNLEVPKCELLPPMWQYHLTNWSKINSQGHLVWLDYLFLFSLNDRKSHYILPRLVGKWNFVSCKDWKEFLLEASLNGLIVLKTCFHEGQKGIKRFYFYIVSATGEGEKEHAYTYRCRL